jgi:integrase
MAKKTNYTNKSGNEYYKVSTTKGMPLGKNGRPKQKVFYGRNKTHAEQLRQEYLDTISKGINENYETLRFIDVFDIWFHEVLRPGISQASYELYEITYRLRIKDSMLSQMILYNIKNLDIQRYINAVANEYTIDTANSTLKLIKNFFSYCFEEYYIERNPCRKIKLPKKDKNKVDEDTKNFLTTEDIKSLIDNSNTNDDALIFVFALFTGLREGEILALEHNDIDFENKTINVNKMLSKVKDETGKYQYTITRPKNEYSIRKIPFDDFLETLIKRKIVIEKEKHLKLGVRFRKDHLLFSSKLLGPLDKRNVLRSWKRLQNKLNINYIKFHGLRHTFCTILAIRGIPLKTASILMGHSDIATTAKYYTHVDEEQKIAAIKELSNFLSNVSPN